MPRALCALVLSFALSPSLIAAAQAQGTQPSGLPPGVYMGEADYKQAPAGTYTLDPDHAAVIARVSHLRYSWSIFRFDKVSGTLKWDPVNPANASISAKVETASITSNVKGFAQDLAGNNFLKSAAFPEATFVLTAFRQMSTRRGKVDGQLTLMGKTKPVTFDVELVAPARASPTAPASASAPGAASIRSISACRRCSAIPSRSSSTSNSRKTHDARRPLVHLGSLRTARVRGAARTRVRGLDGRATDCSLVGTARPTQRSPAPWTSGRAAPAAAA